MGLKILHTADWHLDSPFAGFTGKQREQLKQEQKKIPGKIADLCRRELGVAMDLPERVVCGFFPQNRECLGPRCPYHPAEKKQD